MSAAFEVPASVEVTEDEVIGRHGSIPVRRYRGREARGDSALLVWAHGGAFAWGGLDQLEAHAVAASTAAAGHEVVSVDYRLAPRFSWFLPPSRRASARGHRAPVPMEDLVDSFSSIAASAAQPVVLGGASAGACLAAAAAMRLRDEDAPPPARLVLAYGTFHAELPPIDAALRSRTRGRHSFTQFSPRLVRRMNANYAGDAPRPVFPGDGRLAGLPPTTMIDADRDTLRASGAAFARGLRDTGVTVDYSVVPEAPHGFLDRPDTPFFAAGVDLLLGALDRAAVPRSGSDTR
ncbi:alpha/beta hydrolase fold domain-containing protein [Rathayibacter sp. Leaf299]|uniref:alpha/beta hydrolase fold domain-containing protein n=1 Tax=Rathayibacter sp. Leaf299 TaxID=1736328 RepID=UPI000A79E348|nr:alpha/beta hydrolase fold domain-containing protein [Rathayibacter sp. Leaf299]